MQTLKTISQTSMVTIVIVLYRVIPQEKIGSLFPFVRSENCRKFSPANRRHHNREPIHQSPMLRVTIDAIGQ